jgi:F-type H+-transporting ATPase subunit c
VYFAKILSAGLATIGITGAGIGIGSVFSGFLRAYANNPQLEQDLFGYAILGFALTEATALFSILMSFAFLYAL